MTELKKETCKYCVKGWISVSAIVEDGKIELSTERSDKCRDYGVPCLCPAGENLVKNFKANNNMKIREQAYLIAKGIFQERCAAYFSDPEENLKMRKSIFTEIWASLGKKYEKIKTVNSLMGPAKI